MVDMISLIGLYTLPFLVILTILVFVHEFGHYWVARLNGVRIKEFSVGFGKELFGYTDKNGTRWKFSLIPLGGYVKIFGEKEQDDDAQSAKMTKEELNQAFFTKTVWQRAAIVAAGPIANFLYAITVFAGLFLFLGQPYSRPQIKDVSPDGPAQLAGLVSGDLIIEFAGNAIERFEELQQLVSLYPDQNIKVKVERTGEVLEFTVHLGKKELTDPFGNPQSVGFLGISAEGYEIKQFRPIGALKEGIIETYRLSKMTLVAIGQFFTGARSTDEIGGPIRIAKMSGDVAQGGIYTLLFFSALLSINLGLINLFPIPVLDGGHLLIYLFEIVLRKPLSLKIQNLMFNIGFTTLMLLMVFSFWNDISQLNIFGWFR